MGTQISKSAGLLDQLVARRELQTQLRRKHDETLKQEAVKAAAADAAIAKEASKPDEIEGAREVDRFEAKRQQRENINERQKIQIQERETAKREAIDARRNENSANAKNSVIQAYGLDDPLKILAINKERKDALAAERQISIAEQDKTIEAASVQRGLQNAQFEQDLAEQQEKLRQIQNEFFDPFSVTEATDILKAAEAAEAILDEVKANLEEADAALEFENAAAALEFENAAAALDFENSEIENKGKAREAVKSVLASERKLQRAFSKKIFNRQQVQTQRSEQTTIGAFEENSKVPQGEPTTTLGLVARTEETEPASKPTPDVVEKPKPEDFQILNPQDIRLDSQEELAASKALVKDAVARTNALDVSVKELAALARKTAKKVAAAPVERAPVVRLASSEEAAKAADEAARLTIDDPVRALQSQAVLSVDTAMRVLR